MNNKGDETPHLLMGFILALLIGLALLFLFTRGVKVTNSSFACNTSGGSCVEGSCVLGEQYTLFSGTSGGCKKGQQCCKNITGSEGLVASPECKDKSPGTKCDDKELMYCDAALQCVLKCEFCSKNFDTDFGRSICYGNNEKIKGYFIAYTKDTNSYSCSCTGAECTKARIANGTCIPSYCKSSTTSKSTDSDYMCCVRNLITATTP